MATRKQKRLYTVYYTDGTYLSYFLTKQEYDTIGESLGHDNAVKTEIGFLQTQDMRSIILVKSEVKPKENPSANPDMSPEEADWVKAQQLAERLLAESNPQEFPDDDVDYEGGMMGV